MISSKNNPKIKDTAKLFCSSKSRSQNGLFVIEGLRLCYDALLSKVKIKTVFLTEDCYEKQDKAKEIVSSCNDCFIVTEEIIKHISDTVSPQGIVCVCECLKNDFSVGKEFKSVVLYNVSDPANIGAISRTAEAFDLDLMIVSGGCDIYNPKALRSSMGALFRLPVITVDNDELFKILKENNITSYATVPRNDADKINKIEFDGKSAIIIGNEANGIPEDIIKKCDYKITIPMKGRAESLNAAAAASVSIYEMVRNSL